MFDWRIVDRLSGLPIEEVTIPPLIDRVAGQSLIYRIGKVIAPDTLYDSATVTITVHEFAILMAENDGFLMNVMQDVANDLYAGWLNKRKGQSIV